MANISQLVQGGHLTRDPEVIYISKGDALCKGALAYNHKRGDKEHTMYLDFSMFGKNGENLAKWHVKGDAVLLNGSLEVDEWDDKKTGQKRSKIVMKAQNFTFVKKGGSGGDDDKSSPRPAKSAPQRSTPDSDDVPF